MEDVFIIYVGKRDTKSLFTVTLHWKNVSAMTSRLLGQEGRSWPLSLHRAFEPRLQTMRRSLPAR